MVLLHESLTRMCIFKAVALTSQRQGSQRLGRSLHPPSSRFRAAAQRLTCSPLRFSHWQDSRPYFYAVNVLQIGVIFQSWLWRIFTQKWIGFTFLSLQKKKKRILRRLNSSHTKRSFLRTSKVGWATPSDQHLHRQELSNRPLSSLMQCFFLNFNCVNFELWRWSQSTHASAHWTCV